LRKDNLYTVKNKIIVRRDLSADDYGTFYEV